MGKDFADKFSAARDVFAEASDALHIDLRALCFDEDPRLDRTEFTQPAILVTEIAMFRVLQGEYGLAPAVFGGHSLGEYTALCAAGAMPLADAARLVRRRGALMQAVVPAGQGAMVAVVCQGIAERDLVGELAGIDVDVANRNSPDQIVLSGPTGEIDRAAARTEEILRGLEHDVVRLNVSAPFHSRAMRPMEAELRAALAEAAPHIVPAHARVVTSNLTGGFHVGELAPLVDALVGQASGTVDFIANMRALAGAAEAIYEVGPGRPLRGFFRAMGREVVSIMSTRNLGPQSAARPAQGLGPSESATRPEQADSRNEKKETAA
jgi:[acyl-carrier-protein] S-malonyltransferase/trans-AT polyketide synthase/acyltransferase/oxidoreductase domain-containing protein